MRRPIAPAVRAVQRALQVAAVLLAMVPGFTLCAQAAADGPAAIIFDTDFLMPPADDALALMLALQSPEVRILGVTTVAGNGSVEQATVDALRLLEIAGRSDIPVYRGADMPLVHARSDFAVSSYGEWYSDAPPRAPPGGFARQPAAAQTAVSFIVDCVTSRPGEVTIVALGPLTNVAAALRVDPRVARSVKRLVVMGGAIAALPRGGGNLTPNAEFNFWVDPEAAHTTLRSGVTVELSPLNVARQSSFTRVWYERIVSVDTPFTRLLRDAFGAQFDAQPERSWLLFDPIAMASVIDPAVVASRRMYVDVDIAHGINYGVSVGGDEKWPGAENARLVDVHVGLDWPRFIALFVERVRRPVPGAPE